MSEPLKNFIQRTVARGDTWREIAAAGGTNHSTLLRWLTKDELPANALIKICRAYGFPFGSAFVAAGYLTPEERDSFNGPDALTAVSDEDLLAEVLRRIQAGGDHEALTSPIEDFTVSGTEDNFDSLRQRDMGRVASVSDETGEDEN